jgi:hypothetical protein
MVHCPPQDPWHVVVPEGRQQQSWQSLLREHNGAGAVFTSLEIAKLGVIKLVSHPGTNGNPRQNAAGGFVFNRKV